jgi:hypothetical protein
VKLRYIMILGGMLVSGLIGVLPVTMPAAFAATQQKKPAISEEASAALLRMGQTLRAEQFSFQVRTIRVYGDPSGEPLHIFHTMKVTVHRPNRMLVDISGDDGDNKLVFDGKNAVIYSGVGKNTQWSRLRVGPYRP